MAGKTIGLKPGLARPGARTTAAAWRPLWLPVGKRAPAGRFASGAAALGVVLGEPGGRQGPKVFLTAFTGVSFGNAAALSQQREPCPHRWAAYPPGR